MIISDESPLRRLPSGLNPKQKLYFDGIRYCIEMADLAYARLRRTLYELTQSFDKPDPEHLEPERKHWEFVSAIQDIWSIVDSVQRLRKLLRQCPGIKQRSTGMVLFFKSTKQVEPLRNIIQHLETQINELIERDLPVWGVLTWVTVPNPSTFSGYTCSLIAGTLSPGSHLMINPAGKSILPPIDLITLTAGGNEVCLGHIMSEIEALTRSIEDSMRKQFKELPQAGADLLFVAEFTCQAEGQESTRKPN
jgi:hypothetical protein